MSYAARSEPPIMRSPLGVVDELASCPHSLTSVLPNPRLEPQQGRDDDHYLHGLLHRAKVYVERDYDRLKGEAKKHKIIAIVVGLIIAAALYYGYMNRQAIKGFAKHDWDRLRARLPHIVESRR